MRLRVRTVIAVTRLAIGTHYRHHSRRCALPGFAEGAVGAKGATDCKPMSMYLNAVHPRRQHSHGSVYE